MLFYIYKAYQKSIQYYYEMITNGYKGEKMRKIRFFLSAITLLSAVLMSGYSAAAADCCNTLTYVISEGKAVITGYKGSPKELEIPENIGSAEVTEIRENAFYECRSLKKIEIPESVSQIGHHAFFGCISLECAEINSCAKKLPEGIFYGCTSLKSITLNGSLRQIGNYAFFGCTSLTEFIFPENVSSIGAYSFADCYSLSSVSLDKSLMNIEPYAFYNCKSLEEIELPEKLLSVGRFAAGFSDSGAMENMIISGRPGSIAEHYAISSGIKFSGGIECEKGWVISGRTSIAILVWVLFAEAYSLSMLALYSYRRFRKRGI